MNKPDDGYCVARRLRGSLVAGADQSRYLAGTATADKSSARRSTMISRGSTRPARTRTRNNVGVGTFVRNTRDHAEGTKHANGVNIRKRKLDVSVVADVDHDETDEQNRRVHTRLLLVYSM